MDLPYLVLLSALDSFVCFSVATVLLLRGRKQAWSLIALLYAWTAWVSIPWALWVAPIDSHIFIVRALYAVSAWVPLLVVLFASSFLRFQFPHILIKVGVIFSSVFTIAIHHSWFIRGAIFTNAGALPVPGPAFPLYIAYFSLLSGYAFLSLLRAYASADLFEKKKLQWIALAFLCAAIAGTLHFSSIYTGREPVPHDPFVLSFALLIGYAILKGRLYDIELLTRDAACTIVTTILTALPLVIGRLLAPVTTSLHAAGWWHVLSILLGSLFFLSLAVTLVRYLDNRTAADLCRVFLAIAAVNMFLLIWAVHRNPFALPAMRGLLFMSGAVLLTWVDYRRDYFKDSLSEGAKLYEAWRWSMVIVMMIAAFSPLVIDGIRWHPRTGQLSSISAGPLFQAFKYWWFVNFIGAGIWVGLRFQRILAGSRIASLALAGLSMVAGLLSAYGLFLFVSGRTRHPWFVALELAAGMLMIRTFLSQPHAGQRPTTKLLRQMLISLSISCLAGFMFYEGLRTQLLAGVLLVMSIPRIWREVHVSAQALVDRFIFRKFSYLAEIERIANDIFRFTNLPGLLKYLADDLAQRTALTWVGVWLFDLSESRFLLRQASGVHHFGFDRSDLYKRSFTSEHILMKRLQASPELLVIDDVVAQSAPTGENLSRGSLETIMQEADLAAAFPILLNGKLIGFIGFGPKEDRSLFHQADRGRLADLGQKAEHAIGQSYLLYEQSLMFSKLAHDTLNFLHAMGMNMDILHNEYLGPLNEKQKKQLNIAAHQRDLIRESLIDLRELERLMVLRIQGTWVMEPYDLTEVVKEALGVYEGRAAAQDIHLEKQFSEIPQAIGDARAVRRVIDNLLINALKYTPKGGKIRLELGPAGADVLIRLTDSGPGIAPEELGKIFDPFFRGMEGASVVRGTGLGLSVVKEVTTLHKGSVEVESVAGTGTVFRVRLPTVSRREEFENRKDSGNDVAATA